jgi:hypothetical protein
MDFIVSEKETKNGLLLVITDSDIINKTFEEGKKQLDLTKKFYVGNEKTEQEVKDLIKTAYILHLTGEHAVKLAHSLGLVEKVITIKNVPHAEVVLEAS